MKPLLLLLAAAATIGAAPSRPSRSPVPAPTTRYEAGGFEPFWTLVIESGWLTYNPGQADVPPTRVRVPRRQPTRTGYRYVVSPQLTIDVRHVRCEDYGSRTYADTVYVTGVAEGGCGGRPIAPARLTATVWEIGWLNGVPVRREDGNFLFAYDNVVRGSVGCSAFTVPFTERRPFVQFGRMTVTRRDCGGATGGPGAEGERRILEIFSGRSRISFVDGDTLVLTGRHGTARLTPD
jgi:heat shock protein HslJ